MVLSAPQYARVGPGTLLDEALKKETDSIHLSAYLFNITNADRFASGEDDKLKMEEVGPFTYQENRTNDDMEIDMEAGVVRYTPRHRVSFLPEESIGRPEDMMLTVPNIAMLEHMDYLIASIDDAEASSMGVWNTKKVASRHLYDYEQISD
ncbi:unnamed protein product [Spodoptera exigua]|nr:unnamed protein product [Spodoptera exigua]